MSQTPDGAAAVLAELRRTFDAVFAAPPPDRAQAAENLLALRLGADPFAVRVADLRGFEVLRHLVRLPGAGADLLGLTGIRGALVPVYSLARLMGYAGEPEHRWLLLGGTEETIGLAFGTFEGHFEASRDLFVGAEAQGRSHPHIRELLRGGRVAKDGSAGVRAVIDLPSVMAAVNKRAEPTGPAKE